MPRNVSLKLVIVFVLSYPTVKCAAQVPTRHSIAARIASNLGSKGPAPGAVPATAKGVSKTPGMVLCSDFQTVQLIFRLYSQAWEEQTQDRITNGQSRLLRGPATKYPDLASYGCLMVAPGTKILVEKGNLVPIVNVKIGAAWLKGVTLWAMVNIPVPPTDPETLKAAREAAAVRVQAGLLQRYSQPSVWIPTSNKAEKIGIVRFTIHSLTLGSHDYPIELVQMLDGQETAKFFSFEILTNIDSFLFKTSIPGTVASPNESGPCATDVMQWAVMVISDRSTDQFDLALFSGDKPPSIGSSANEETDHLCGIYKYRKTF